MKIVYHKYNLMISSLVDSGHPRKYSYEIPHETFTEQPLHENMKFLKAVTFRYSYFFDGGIFQNTTVFRRPTFSKQVLLHCINFLRRATFWKTVIFQKSNIPHYLLFLENYLFIVATFSKDVIPSIEATFSEELLFYNKLFQKSYYFTATPPFHSHTSSLSVSN